MNIFSGNILQRVKNFIRPKAAPVITGNSKDFKMPRIRINTGPVEDQFTAYFRTGGGCLRKRHI